MSISIIGRTKVTGKIALRGVPQFIPPSSGTITAQLIYHELDGAPSASYLSVLGVNGDTLMALTTGTKLMLSTDAGANWNTFGNLPSISGTQMGSRGMQYHEGRWYFQLSSGNSDAYIGSTIDGSSWTIGPNLYNDRYASHSFYIKSNDELIFAGRRSTVNNHVIWARYPSEYGSSTIPALWQDGPDNRNAVGMLNLSDGIWSGMWNGTNYDCYFVNDSMSTLIGNATTNWGNVVGHFESNNDQVVLIADSGTEVMRWKKDYASGTLPTLALTGNTATRAYTALGWNDTIWMASTSSGNSTTWDLYHNEDPTAETGFTKGAILQLPSTQTSSGSNATYNNIFPGPGNIWYGVYREQGNNRLNIIKWQYGSYG